MNRRWDLLVLLTFDQSQKSACELFIKENFTNEASINSFDEIRIYSDPDIGVKLGAGGGVLFALDKLEKEFGLQLFQKRVLMIASGGFCQRQPNASALGKLFSIVPISLKNRPMTLLDLKLEIYRNFVQFVPPGIFFMASDTVEYYEPKFLDILTSSQLTFPVLGITALAYCSSITVAEQHGVYVVEDYENPSHFKNVRKILQKPSYHEMKLENATLQPGKKEIALTDSVYFMGMDIVQILIDFIRQENFRIDCEICAYGDFLRPLGRDNRPEEYVKTESQKKLFNALKGQKIQALIIPESKFYHLGTFSELFDHFCGKKSGFFCDFSLKNRCFAVKCPKLTNACVILSMLGSESQLSDQSIIEICRFDMGLIINAQNCILSYCSCKETVFVNQPVFMMTVPIRNDQDELQYATVFFETFANLKKMYAVSEEMKYFGCKVDNVKFSNGQNFSLWTAKLFPAAKTMTSSFKLTLDLYGNLANVYVENGGKFLEKIDNLYSIAELIQLKDVDEIFRFRKEMKYLCKE